MKCGIMIKPLRNDAKLCVICYCAQWNVEEENYEDCGCTFCLSQTCVFDVCKLL